MKATVMKKTINCHYDLYTLQVYNQKLNSKLCYDEQITLISGNKSRS